MLSRFPAGHLLSIEPDPGNFEVLRANLAPYGDAARLLRSAVWSHPTGLVLSRDPYRDGMEWTRQVRECRPGELPDLVAVDIGSVLRQFPGERISILKMDIEGAERVVFGSNYETWIDLVDNIVIELHDDSVFGDCTATFATAIAGRGFSVARHGELTVCRRR
jgi:FkbM family methyltransferase